MKIIILTGNELRHKYFRKKLSQEHKIDVLKTFCESDEKSLENTVKNNSNSSAIEIMHVESRKQSEIDFFEDLTNNLTDYSNPEVIKKGRVNDKSIVDEIIDLNPDLLVCYGSSIIKSVLVDIYAGKFLNVHLGLSPYYRGSGTNVWPIINNEIEYIGATFMYLDSGIDTGEVIHQIQPQFFLGDSPHSIGNRLIKDMVKTYTQIILRFNKLTKENQITGVKSKFYRRRDFNQDACERLYSNITKMIPYKKKNEISIIQNKGLVK